MHGLFAFLDLNPMTMLILGVVAVLLYGERLPEVARKFGKQLMELRKGLHSVQEQFHSALDSAVTPESPHREALPHEAVDREEATAPKFEPPPPSPHRKP